MNVRPFAQATTVAIGLCTSATAIASDAGRVELTPTIGYLFGGSLDTENGSASMDDGPTAGGSLAVRARPNAIALLRYTRQETGFKLRNDGETLLEFDAHANYIQIGGAIEFRPRPFRPYAGLTLGTAGWVPDNDVSSAWRFSSDLFMGLKWLPTQHVGLQAQADLLMTVVQANGALFCGLPGGCWVAASGQAVLQGHVSGGLVVAF